MDLVRQLILLLVAPALYFAVGLPWVTRGRVAWAPLWGIGVLGMTAQLAYIAGLPAWPCVAGMALLHLAAAMGRSRTNEFQRGLKSAVIEFAGCYLIALLPFVATPFPIPGGWGGDWILALESGRHIFSGEKFTSDLLARPPLFGAASILLLPAGAPLVSFQVFCAVASGCLLQVFLTGLRAAARFRLLWILAGSVFFLQTSANAWPKLLCAAYLLAAWHTMDSSGRGSRIGAGILLGLALAVHQSAVLFVPLVVSRAIRANETAASRVRAVAMIGAMALLVAIPWEAYTLAAYGLEAKWLANPVVSQRLQDMPAWLNAVLVGVTTFVAWGPVNIIIHWFAAPDRFSLLRIGHEAYWFVTASFNAAAGTLAGLILPWWTALGTRGLWQRLAAGFGRLSAGEKVSAALALAGQMMLNPFYSAEGSLQTGWVPAAVALSLWLAHTVQESPGCLDRIVHHIFWISTAPWLGFNLLLTAALALSPWFGRNFTDTDLAYAQQHGWETLALGGFPWVQAGVLIPVAILVRRFRAGTSVAITANGTFKPATAT